MKWTNASYTAILNSLLPAFNEARKKKVERNAVIEDASQQIIKLAGQNDEEVPLNLSKKIETWFRNHRSAKDGKEEHNNIDHRCAVNWTVRKVVKELMSKEIEAAIKAKDPNCKPGDQAYFKLFPTTWSEVTNGLSEEKREQYQQLAEKWSKEGLSKEMKAKNAEKRFAEYAGKFMKEASQQMGIHVFMLVGWEDDSGNLVKTKLETSRPGLKQDQFLPIFNQFGDEVWENWDEFLGKTMQGNETKDNEEDEDDNVHKTDGTDKSILWVLEHDGDHWPLLPPSTGKTLAQVKDILRTFLTLIYRRQANKQNVAVPWHAIANDPNFFINSDDLPENVKIVELSKMRSEHLLSCYHKWLKRQTKGRTSFRFKAVAPQHVRMRRSKRTKLGQKKIDETSDEEETEDSGSDSEREATSQIKLDVSKTVSSKQPDPAKEDGSPACVGDDFSSQMDFLKTLSQEFRYQKVLSLVERLPVDSPITVRIIPPPKSISWDYAKKHFSVQFHKSRDAFEEINDWLKSTPYCSDFQEPYPRKYSTLSCLALGLLFRDIETIQFFEEDNDNKVPLPSSLKNSSLSWNDYQVLSQRCKQMETDLKLCHEAVSEHFRQNIDSDAHNNDNDKLDNHDNHQLDFHNNGELDVDDHDKMDVHNDGEMDVVHHDAKVDAHNNESEQENGVSSGSPKLDATADLSQIKKTPGSKCLSALSQDQNNWPAWLQAVFKYLVDVSPNADWVEAVTRFMELEKSLGYHTGSARLETTGRPEAVQIWLKYGRKLDHPPMIKDLTQFAKSWWAWWYNLQPALRKGSGGKLSKQTIVSEDWNGIRKGGPNGFVMVMLTLSWWMKRDGEGGDFSDALADTNWVLQQVIQDSASIVPMGTQKRTRNQVPDEEGLVMKRRKKK